MSFHQVSRHIFFHIKTPPLFIGDQSYVMNKQRDNAIGGFIQPNRRATDFAKLASSCAILLDSLVLRNRVSFSVLARMSTKAQVCTILDIITEALSEKYLGLPANARLDKSVCFQYLVDRLIQRMAGWREKIVSSGGKETLLKSVAQAITTYAMLVFKNLKTNCKRITDAMSQYWWDDDANHKRMH